MERIWVPVEERDRLNRKQIAELFLAQQGRCPICGQRLETKGHTEVSVIPDGEHDLSTIVDSLVFTDEHMEPLWRGGTNALSNRALVCNPCARSKTAKEAKERAKGKRVRDKHIGAIRKKKWPSRKFGRS